MEAHLAPKPSVQVNKIASSCEICGGPHDTQICMENPEKAFFDYASSRTDEAGDARLSKFEADFKQQQSEMTNKIDIIALPSDTIKNPKLNVNPASSVSSARSYPIEDPQSSSRPFNSVNDIKMCFKATNDFQKDQLQVKTLTVNKVETPKSKEPERTLEDEFKDLHLKLPVLEVLAHAPMNNAILDKYVESLELGKNGSAFIQGEMPKKMKDPGLFTLPWLANGTRSYPVGIVKNAEVHVRKLKLLEDFYIIDMEKDPMCPLLIGRGFLATTSAIIDYKKAKIAAGEGVTRSIFGVKEICLGHVDTPYWTTLSKWKSYESRPSTNYIAVPINIKGNMWESKDLIEKKIDWKRPPKEEDGVWHIKIEIINLDGENFDTTFQSISTKKGQAISSTWNIVMIPRKSDSKSS
ncbi:MAK10-like protein [Tanacetum coccineum]|uniref:MAK10-like protein n=1 Tax=Tanacetum coccineum TaxID=301880 RepID=A0ABQ5GW78_9ASTR